ncbi:transporter substrate-binding domain-containing protein [Castellaniella sp.]|uniref:transporter substrate-binding domain-containing protein n=1 Tax=Castellaniella sp. TaxID=1955812 RepID=UPI003C7795C6
MVSKTARVGVLISTTGTYGAVGQTIVNGVRLAARELEETARGIRLDLSFADPAGNNSRYVALAEEMLQSGIRHVIGCYTSSSRQQLLPSFERYRALLWYPAHYEGFEVSDNVVYTGTAPNHHIHPMIDYMMDNHGRTAYCVGSDYIWAWESNRVFRDEFTRRGGLVLGEKYIPIDGLDIDEVIQSILEQPPAFILNTLIGRSSYHFFRSLRKACLEKGVDQCSEIPVVSCNLSEADLHEIGQGAVDGHFSSSVYFSTVDTPENKAFVKAYRGMCPRHECLPTVEAEAAYIATRLLGAALADVPEGSEIEQVRKQALNYRFFAPQGEVRLDPLTFHTYLTPRMGISNKSGEFDIVAEADHPVRPDPYLVGLAPDTTLKLVSTEM